MKIRIVTAAVFAGILLAGISGARAQTGSYEAYPGYVDFGALGVPEDAEERVEIFLESPILTFVAKLSASNEPEFARFLEKIVLIKANIFSMASAQRGSIKERIDSISGALKAKNWQRMVFVRDNSNEFEFYSLLDDNRMQGLAVMGIEKDDNKAVFLNIVGEIDPEQLGRLSQKFNIPGIDSIPVH